MMEVIDNIKGTGPFNYEVRCIPSEAELEVLRIFLISSPTHLHKNSRTKNSLPLQWRCEFLSRCLWNQQSYIQLHTQHHVQVSSHLVEGNNTIQNKMMLV